jgi:hypothetical protein
MEERFGGPREIEDFVGRKTQTEAGLKVYSSMQERFPGPREIEDFVGWKTQAETGLEG